MCILAGFILMPLLRHIRKNASKVPSSSVHSFAKPRKSSWKFTILAMCSSESSSVRYLVNSACAIALAFFAPMMSRVYLISPIGVQNVVNSCDAFSNGIQLNCFWASAAK